jgi:hypothetical protein
MQSSLPLVLGTMLTLSLDAVSAFAFECPVPHPATSTGAIRETPAQMEEYTSTLAEGDTGNAVETVVADIRSKHPHVTREQMVNFLVTAYCPAVEAEGYGDTVATRKIREFSDLVTKRLYGNP